MYTYINYNICKKKNNNNNYSTYGSYIDDQFLAKVVIRTRASRDE